MTDETNTDETVEVESLADVFSNADSEPEKVEEEATDVKPDEIEESAETEEKSEEGSPSEPERDQQVPLAALLDERDKRQKFEAELKDREARLAELTKPADKKRPDVFEDPDGAFNHVVQELRNEMTDKLFRVSRSSMMRAHDDYAEREAEFMELAKDTPALRQELLAHDDPAWFAYQTAVKHRELKELENIDEVKEKMRAELREEILAELKSESESKEEKDAAKREAITPSLATKRSTSGLDTDVDDSLDEALGHK